MLSERYNVKAWFTLTLGETQDRRQPRVTKVIDLPATLSPSASNIRIFQQRRRVISDNSPTVPAENDDILGGEKLAVRLLFIDQEYVDIKKNKCMIITYAYIAISMQNIF